MMDKLVNKFESLNKKNIFFFSKRIRWNINIKTLDLLVR
jgi:hypothetical protein